MNVDDKKDSKGPGLVILAPIACIKITLSLPKMPGLRLQHHTRMAGVVQQQATSSRSNPSKEYQEDPPRPASTLILYLERLKT